MRENRGAVTVAEATGLRRDGQRLVDDLGAVELGQAPASASLLRRFVVPAAAAINHRLASEPDRQETLAHRHGACVACAPDPHLCADTKDDHPTPAPPRSQRSVPGTGETPRMRTALYTALLTLMLAAHARAAPRQPMGWRDSPPATDGLLLEAVNVADTYWAGHGRGACAPTVLVYDEWVPRVDARADQPGCRVRFDRTWWTKVRAKLARGGVHRMRRTLTLVCALAIHERGHNLGLSHSHDRRSIMYPVIHARPKACRTWARRLARISALTPTPQRWCTCASRRR